MKTGHTKEEIFKHLPIILDRLCPFIITEIDEPSVEAMLQKALTEMEPLVTLDYIESPKKLFQFIKEHQNDLIVIKDDVFAKSKTYLDIAQGAACSNPDSMAFWNVRYLNEREFTFRGKLLLCTRKTKEEIKANKRFEYFERDCHFI